MKKKLLFIAAVVICLSLVAGGTWAYYTAENTAHNVITSGNVDIALQEWGNEEKTEAFKDLDGIMPGQAATKIVEVKNTGSGDAFIAVKVDVKILPKEEGTEVDPAMITLDYNTDDWTQGTDGIWYYNTKTATDEVTEPLFTKVAFDTAMGNDYQECTVTIDVTAYAVQAANNGATVMDAQGWPY